MLKKGLITVIKILSLIFIVLLLTYLFRFCKEFGTSVFDDRSKDIANTPTVVNAVVTILEDETLMELGEDLEKKEIIRDKLTFVVAIRCRENYDKIVPGIYELNSGMKPSEILTKITTPKAETKE